MLDTSWWEPPSTTARLREGGVMRRFGSARHSAARGIAAVAVTTSVLLTLLAAASPAAGQQEQAASGTNVDEAVARLLALPYDPAAQPTGLDAAFGDSDYPAAFPITDTSTGTCCTGPVPDQPPLADLAPPFADWPATFELIELTSADGTPLHAYMSIVPGAPGVVVMHGFNTNGKYSAVRYAAFLRANGYSVIAPDHRDMGREWTRGGSWHPDGTRHGQTLGWKEAEDLLAAAATLADRGVDTIGVLGFSEGAQNTILALGRDHSNLIDAAITFSPPADQASLAQRSPATTAALLTTVVNQPDLCTYLADVGAREEFRASPNFMLRHDSAVDTLDGIVGAGVDTPAVHFHAQDDELVPSWNAVALASRTLSMPSQATVLIESGNHAYFTDRWWTQVAVLTWFETWLDGAGTVTTSEPTIAQPAAGRPLSEQTIDLSGTTREEGDAELRERGFCPQASEPIGPTALLLADGGEDGAWKLDGRRSYSGWDDHAIVAWELDLGDGTRVQGTDPHAATVTHHYRAAGSYEVTLTVQDDTGRQASTVRTIEVGGAAAPGPPTGGDTGETGDGTDRGLPATGGGAVIALLAAAAGGALHGRRRERQLGGRPPQ